MKLAPLSSRLWMAGLLVVLLLLPLGLDDYLLHILVLVFLYSYLSTAWNILGGYAGQHSLGHSLFLGAGAYTSTVLFANWQITPWLGMWIGGGVAALIALFVGYLCFRYGLKGPYFALVTIAFAEAALVLVVNLDFLGGARGLEVPLRGQAPLLFQFEGKAGYYYIALAMAAAGVLITRWLNRSRFGYFLIALRENEDAAEAIGVGVLRTKIAATVLSAFLTALGGTFYAQYFTYINPRSVFGEGPSVQILLFSIIGGLGTVWGPTVGAFVLVPFGELTRVTLSGSFAGAHLLLYGTVMMLVIIFLPNGLMGLFQDWRARRAGRGDPGGRQEVKP